MRRTILVVLALLAAAIWFTCHPPRVWLNWRKQVEPTAEVGAALVDHYGCRRCHRIGGQGGLVGPNLRDITRRVSDPAQVTLRLWLRDPRAIKSSTPMPNFHLSDSEIEAILIYLKALDEGRSP